MRILSALPIAALLLNSACGKQEHDQAASLNADIPPGAAQTGNRSDDNAENAGADDTGAFPTSSSSSSGTSSHDTPASGSASSVAATKVVSANIIPDGFLGLWTGIDVRCGDRSSALRLKVEPDTLRFYESVGTVTAVSQAGADAIMVDARYEGEGQTWSRKQRLTVSTDRSLLTVAAEGAAVTRKRCPATS